MLSSPFISTSEIINDDKFTIKHWAEDDRPREKLLLKGKSALSDAELLAIIINSGNRDESAVDLAKRILSTVEDNIDTLSKCNLKTLMSFKGIGLAKAISIVAGLELGHRKQLAIRSQKIDVKSSFDAYETIRHHLEDLPHEEFWILHLNHSLKLIKKEQISIGGLTSTIVDIRLLTKSCIESLTTNLILCHNHPSEKLQASEADIKITLKIKNALSIFDIHVKDHIIIAGKEYLSFADQGMI